MVFMGSVSFFSMSFMITWGHQEDEDFPGEQVACSLTQAQGESSFEELAQMWMDFLGNL